MSKKKPRLSGRQKRFAELYVQSGNITQSALDAGYSRAYATGQGYMILESEVVKDYIKELNAKIEKETIADMIEVKQFWTEVMRDSSSEHKDRLRASEFMAKTNGAFLDRVERSGGMELNIQWLDEDGDDE